MTGSETTVTFTPCERDLQSAGFFDGAATNRLMVLRCAECGTFLYPDVARCTSCSNSRLDWAETAGRATLVSWSVAHHRAGPDGEPPAPTILGLLELDEGPWLYARLAGVDPARLAVGQRFAVRFHHPAHGESMPYFIPEESSS
jgi:hypothetical protein